MPFILDWFQLITLHSLAPRLRTLRASNIRLRFDGMAPIDLNRLDTDLKLNIGRLQIEDLALHFSRAVASRIIAAQAETLAAPPPPADAATPRTLGDLAIDICIAKGLPKIDQTTSRRSGEVLLAPDQCADG